MRRPRGRPSQQETLPVASHNNCMGAPRGNVAGLRGSPHGISPFVAGQAHACARSGILRHLD